MNLRYRVKLKLRLVKALNERGFRQFYQNIKISTHAAILQITVDLYAGHEHVSAYEV